MSKPISEHSLKIKEEIHSNGYKIEKKAKRRQMSQDENKNVNLKKRQDWRVWGE